MPLAGTSGKDHHPKQGAWDTKEVLSSFRFDKRGRLVFGSVGALRGTGTGIHKAWARRALSALP